MEFKVSLTKIRCRENLRLLKSFTAFASVIDPSVYYKKCFYKNEIWIVKIELSQQTESPFLFQPSFFTEFIVVMSFKVQNHRTRLPNLGKQSRLSLLRRPLQMVCHDLEKISHVQTISKSSENLIQPKLFEMFHLAFSHYR